MGRSFFKQDTQIFNSIVYDDTVAAGSTLETGAAHLQDDLNAIRSQIKRLIFDDAAGDWWADIPTVNSKKRAVSDLNTDLDDLEEKRFLFRAQVLTDITVGAGNNFVVLSQAGSETPTQTAAVDGGTANGAVVATLPADVGSHSLNEVSGPTALRPKNLALVRDSTTGQPIQAASGKDIYALVQAENGVVDGDSFNDADHQVQLSFVVENAAGDDLIAAPVADIENKTINYSYVRRINLDAIPEHAFLSGVFIDQSVAGTDVTLNNAIDNQVGAATQTDRNIQWQITDTFALDFEDSTGSRDLLKIAPNAAGDAVSFDTDDFSVTNANTATFTNGVGVDTGGTQLNLGVTAGQIDSAGALTLLSAASADVRMEAANEIFFDDVNQSTSTWTQNGIKLSETTQEWDDFETAFGEVSLMRAIYLARGGVRTKGVAVATSDEAADVNMTGAGGTPNLDAQLPDYSGVTFVTDVDVYLNGQLLRNGADASANHDVYPGDTPANGDLKFEFNIIGTGTAPDVITMIVWG